MLARRTSAPARAQKHAHKLAPSCPPSDAPAPRLEGAPVFVSAKRAGPAGLADGGKPQQEQAGARKNASQMLTVERRACRGAKEVATLASKLGALRPVLGLESECSPRALGSWHHHYCRCFCRCRIVSDQKARCQKSEGASGGRAQNEHDDDDDERRTLALPTGTPTARLSDKGGGAAGAGQIIDISQTLASPQPNERTTSSGTHKQTHRLPRVAPISGRYSIRRARGQARGGGCRWEWAQTNWTRGRVGQTLFQITPRPPGGRLAPSAWRRRPN